MPWRLPGVSGEHKGSIPSLPNLLTRRQLGRLAANSLGAVGIAGLTACGGGNKYHHKRGRSFRPETFGALGNGTTDDTNAIQAAVDHASMEDGFVELRAEYGVGQSILARDNVTLRFDTKARLRRLASGHALIRNARFDRKLKYFVIAGPGQIGALDHTFEGQTIFLYGDHIQLSGFTIRTYSGGQAILIGGDHNRVSSLQVLDPSPQYGVGGIRMFGGRDFRASDCHVISGDDTYQFTPIASENHDLRDLSISDSSYADCTGGSLQSRLAVAVLSTSPPGGGSLTASISDVSFTGCTGFAARRGVVIANTDSSGALQRVKVGGTLNLNAYRGGGAQAVLIERARNAGFVREITLDLLRIDEPAGASLAISGDATSGSYVENVIVNRCRFQGPPNSAATITALGVDGLDVIRTRVIGSGQGFSFLGGSDKDRSRDVNIIDSTFTMIGRGAIRLPQTSGFRINGCAFVSSDLQDAEAGVSVGERSTGGSITGNDFTRLAGPRVTGLTGP